MYFDRKKLNSEDVGNFPEELRNIFVSYRDTLPDPEPSTNFMPALWARIESKQKMGYNFGRFSRRLVTGAGACCLLMSGLLVTPLSQTPGVFTATYVDVLANEHVDEVAVDVEANRIEQL
jgi:hypothetical protein